MNTVLKALASGMLSVFEYSGKPVLSSLVMFWSIADVIMALLSKVRPTIATLLDIPAERSEM